MSANSLHCPFPKTSSQEQTDNSFSGTRDGAKVKLPLRSWCLQGMQLPMLTLQSPSALANAFPASEHQGSSLPGATRPTTADYTGLSSSRDMGLRNTCPTPSIERLPVSRRREEGSILHFPETYLTQLKPGAVLRNWGQAGDLRDPREQGEQSGGPARQEQRGAGWPRSRVQPTLAACLESVY